MLIAVTIPLVTFYFTDFLCGYLTLVSSVEIVHALLNAGTVTLSLDQSVYF